MSEQTALARARRLIRVADRRHEADLRTIAGLRLALAEEHRRTVALEMVLASMPGAEDYEAEIEGVERIVASVFANDSNNNRSTP